MAAAGEASGTDYLVEGEVDYVGAYSIDCSSELLALTQRTHTWNSCTLHGNMSDVSGGSLIL